MHRADVQVLSISSKAKYPSDIIQHFTDNRKSKMQFGSLGSDLREKAEQNWYLVEESEE